MVSPRLWRFCAGPVRLLQNHPLDPPSKGFWSFSGVLQRLCEGQVMIIEVLWGSSQWLFGYWGCARVLQWFHNGSMSGPKTPIQTPINLYKYFDNNLNSTRSILHTHPPTTYTQPPHKTTTHHLLTHANTPHHQLMVPRRF